MNRKTFVLDTNVLLAEPGVIYSFDEHDIIIPLIVIEELDKFKKDNGKLGFVAREFSREVDKLRTIGNLTTGVKLGETHGTIKIVDIDNKILSIYQLDLSINDNIIIATALFFKETLDNVVLVSKDVNVRIKCDIVDISSETYFTGSVDYNKIPKGMYTLINDGDFIDLLYKNSEYVVNDLNLIEEFPELTPNSYFLVKSEMENKQIIVKYKINTHDDEVFVKLNSYKNKKPIYGIRAKNIEQEIAIDMLLDPNIKLVNLIGKAGTGKSLISIAVGLQEVIENGNYNKFVVARPIFPMGNDIGYLPGDVNEKLRPWIQPIIDNIEFLFQGKGKYASFSENQFNTVYDLLESDFIHVEALTYIRGRTIPNQYILIDEAQNLSIHEIKTIISRAGEGTKIVLTGDPQQIDSPYLTKENNGLVYSMDKMKDSTITSHIILEKGERSELADLAVAKL